MTKHHPLQEYLLNPSKFRKRKQLHQLKLNKLTFKMAPNEINHHDAERTIQHMILQTALAAQAPEVYTKEVSADRDERWFRRTLTACYCCQYHSSSFSEFFYSFKSPKNSSQYGVSFCFIQRTRRNVHIGYVTSCCGSSIRFGLRIFLFDFYSGGFL